MGKRKERRLAAMSSAGRRVKLDLFAEPSGDLGGSSATDGVGKDDKAKLDAELPNLPSSSGKQAENPLSLLGQYSDDDLEEGSNDIAGVQDDSLPVEKKQMKVSEDISCEAGEAGGSEEPSSQKGDNHIPETDSASVIASLGEAGAVMSNKVISDENCQEASVENQNPIPGAFDTQTAGDVSSCWKMVLHEESNRYYYWNTVTGETSWEVPAALAQGTGLVDEHRMLVTSIEESATNTNASNPAFGVSLDGYPTRDATGYENGVSDVTAVSVHQSEANQSMEQHEGAGSLLLGNCSVVGAFPYEASTVGSYSLSGLLNTGVGNHSADSHDVHGHDTMVCPPSAANLPSHLLRRAELMLEKLKMLHGCGSDQPGWISKYMVEIEVRISDIRALICHGSTLDEFWLHSERLLNQLESVINSENVGQNNRKSGMHLSSTEEKEEKPEDRGEETKLEADMRTFPLESSANLHDADAFAIPKTALDSPSGQISKVQQLSEQNNSTLLEEGEIDESASEGSPNAEFQPGEDVDMDIDMEVEDPSPSRMAQEQSVQPSATIAEHPMGTDNEFIVPPPPDEEWIPPPPPDDEGIPPPPPDEPPESCPPPNLSEPDSVLSIYNEQYNMTYGGSNVHYYDNVSTDASGSSLYGLADGSQAAALSSAIYYTAASAVQPTVVSNPVESVVYYGFQNGVVPIVPDPTQSVMSSDFQTLSGQMNFVDLSSKEIGTVSASAENSATNQPINSFLPGTKAGMASSEVSLASVISAPATSSAKEYVSVPHLSAAATSSTEVHASAITSDVAVPLPKAQAKASKTKKPKVAVASSLRSNKKVSSLVDKWKAAKEELEEKEEEERETPLEILEKKRQREIEEWRAQQIASGEAKENANFQPLGGDWRARVKRRRAQKGATKVEALLNIAASDTDTKGPDLNEMSKDLPPGWQAYWDDSSKQAYYANSITSETTWTKPTK